MNYVEHTITLKSTQHYGSRVPPDALGLILSWLPKAVALSTRMAFVGRSTPRRHPSWLEAASDIRFVKHSGEDETVLFFEAPSVGEAATEIYQQQELWPSRPAPEDTGLDLLGDVLMDISAGNRDSELFDTPLLKNIASVRRALDGKFQEIHLAGHRFTDQKPAIVNQTVIQTAEQFSSITPIPERTRIVGQLDMIRASTQTFALKLSEGQEVRGVLLDTDIGRLKHLFQREVLVLGRAVFRPSGKLLRIDAEDIRPAEEESSLWSRVPKPRMVRLDVAGLRKSQGPRSGVASIIGKWPGNETDEEVQRELEALS